MTKETRQDSFGFQIFQNVSEMNDEIEGCIDAHRRKKATKETVTKKGFHVENESSGLKEEDTNPESWWNK